MLRVSKGEKVMEKVEALGLAPLTFSDSLTQRPWTVSQSLHSHCDNRLAVNRRYPIVSKRSG
jgi:hypothetical protein